ncbi:Catechol 2,3-dioxygenase [Cohaesibacter sp. ES.047]|uniref:VOC family protein n=1 Tax=Cohaesibacter sp. ES.047 TaxID=1798205 RepID=UPI000BB6F1DC|nr:VOC family protein [Cohaesibacter sp. ES.047]SNY92515.1 Catechol 2,3-dioxygenase [Cohaesibacter sp. ES.047]
MSSTDQLQDTEAQEAPVIMAHVSIGVKDFAKSKAFYEAVLGTIGAKIVMDVDAPTMQAAAFGKQFPEFWVQTPHDGGEPGVANGTHFAFLASSVKAVHAFWDTAIEMGGVPDGEPGPRPHYGEAYYGCFLRDPDGHKIEAMFWGAHDQFKDGEAVKTSG